MANVKIGYGAQLWVADGTDVLIKVGELNEISLPNPQVDEVEATHFESPDQSKEYIPGLKDNGEVTYGINYIAGDATDDLISGALQNVRRVEVIVPAGSGAEKFAFSALFKGYEKTVPINDRQTAVITMRVSGAVVQTSTTLP